MSEWRQSGRILLIDYDGTLVDQNMKCAYMRLLAELGLDKDKSLLDNLYGEDRFLARHGLYDRQYVFWKYANHIGHDRSPLDLCKMLWEHVSETQKPKDGCQEALAKLRKAGHKLICFTDTDGPGSDKTARVNKSGLTEYFDNVVVAYDAYGKNKGQHGLLDRMLAEMDLPQNRCVAIGDKVTSDLYPAQVARVPCIQVCNREYPDRWPYHTMHLEALPEMVSALCERVFISYSHQDKFFVQQLVTKLRAESIEPWLDERIRPGEYVLDSISQAIATSTVVFVVVSKHSIASPWVKLEVNMAFSQLLEQDSVKTIIPLVIDIQDSPPWLRVLRYVDFRQGFDNAFRDLLGAIQDVMSTGA